MRGVVAALFGLLLAFVVVIQCQNYPPSPAVGRPERAGDQGRSTAGLAAGERATSA